MVQYVHQIIIWACGNTQLCEEPALKPTALVERLKQIAWQMTATNPWSFVTTDLKLAPYEAATPGPSNNAMSRRTMKENANMCDCLSVASESDVSTVPIFESIAAFLSLMLWASVSYDFSPSELDRSRLLLRLDGLVEDFSAILASNNIPIEGFKRVSFSKRDAPTFQNIPILLVSKPSFLELRHLALHL